MSPSPRRAWIEICALTSFAGEIVSPSPRRAWIEITLLYKEIQRNTVALPTEGVD